MKFRKVVVYDDKSEDDRLISGKKLRQELLSDINTGCVDTINVYKMYGKKNLGRIFHFDRDGKKAPWQLNISIR